MKFVAVVSSSMSSRVDPTSRASRMFAAWLVLPDESADLKLLVSLPAIPHLHCCIDCCEQFHFSAQFGISPATSVLFSSREGTIGPKVTKCN